MSRNYTGEPKESVVTYYTDLGRDIPLWPLPNIDHAHLNGKYSAIVKEMEGDSSYSMDIRVQSRRLRDLTGMGDRVFLRPVTRRDNEEYFRKNNLKSSLVFAQYKITDLLKMPDQSRVKIRDSLTEMGRRNCRILNKFCLDNPNSLDDPNSKEAVGVFGCENSGDIQVSDVADMRREVSMACDLTRIKAILKEFGQENNGEAVREVLCEIQGCKFEISDGKKWGKGLKPIRAAMLRSIAPFVVFRFNNKIVLDSAGNLIPAKDRTSVPMYQGGVGQLSDGIRAGSGDLDPDRLVDEYKGSIAVWLKMAARNDEGVSLVLPNAFISKLPSESQKDLARKCYMTAIRQSLEEMSGPDRSRLKGVFLCVGVNSDKECPSVSWYNALPMKLKSAIVLHTGDIKSPQMAAKKLGLQDDIGVVIMSDELGPYGNGCMSNRGNKALEENMYRRSCAPLVTHQNPAIYQAIESGVQIEEDLYVNNRRSKANGQSQANGYTAERVAKGGIGNGATVPTQEGRLGTYALSGNGHSAVRVGRSTFSISGNKRNSPQAERGTTHPGQYSTNPPAGGGRW